MKKVATERPQQALPWFLALLIISWYGASTMNAVATQEFVAQSQLGNGLQRDANAMLVVTITQLLVGALMGSLILLASGNAPRIEMNLSLWLIVPALHAMGSLFTNMGFTYGSASIVQVIKLLEPVETLIVSKLLGSATVVSAPILASLALLIGGTVGTLSGWEKPPTMMAVTFASLSGVSLATRNAAKKRFQEKGKSSGFVEGVKEFVNLSVWGAISLAIPCLLNAVVFHRSLSGVVDAEVIGALLDHPKMIVFHGLYNLSSLAVLGYVSALTHSVMNVGKRMTNIVVASVFFSEKLSLGKVGFGLAVASTGMLWYTALSKGALGSPSFDFSKRRRPMRMCVLIFMLALVLRSFLQQVEDGRMMEADTPHYNSNASAELVTAEADLPNDEIQNSSSSSYNMGEEDRLLAGSDDAGNTGFQPLRPINTSSVIAEDDSIDREEDPVVGDGSNTSLDSYDATDNSSANATDCVVTLKRNLFSCHYLAYGSNFGDTLGPLVVDKILERKFAPCKVETKKFDIAPKDGKEPRRDDQSCLFAVGSVFAYLQPNDVVWGIGSKADQAKVPPNVDVFAVRGPRTNGIYQLGTNSTTILPQGDPGFLLPFLFPDVFALKPDVKHEFCLVYHAKDTRFVKKHSKEDDDHHPNLSPILTIDPRRPWKDVVQTIHSCKYVAGSSLHGIIIADSLGIPTLWFQVAHGNSKSEGTFKYTDYFGSIGRNVTRPSTNWNALRNRALYNSPIPLEQRQAMWNRMLDSFPYELAETKGSNGVSLDGSNLTGVAVNHAQSEPPASDQFSSIESQGCVASFQSDFASCHYLAYGSNFGDALGPLIVDRILDTHFAPCRADTKKLDIAPSAGREEDRTRDQPCFFVVGSVFHYLQPNDALWGIGSKTADAKFSPGVDVYGVRGPNTNAIYQSSTNTTTILPQGDPGFLLPALFPEVFEAEPETKHEFCIVYHAKDYRFVMQQLKRDAAEQPDRPQIHTIGPLHPWKDVVQSIQSCKYVAGSSLHGIIIAESLGIPTLWFQCPNGGTSKSEGTFKYRDYFGAMGRPDFATMRPVTQWERLTNSSLYSVPIPLAERQSIWKRMLDSFPYHMFGTKAATVQPQR